MPPARISLTLSCYFSLSFIASGMSSGLHPVSSHRCYRYVRAGRPAFARPYVGVHRSTSIMSSSFLLKQCPACLVRLAWIVFVMGGRWQYSWCLVGCCHQDLFNIARNILVWLPSSFFSSRLVSAQVVHPYSGIDMTAACKKLCFILSVRSDFHMIDNLSIAVHTFVSSVSMSFSVGKAVLQEINYQIRICIITKNANLYFFFSFLNFWFFFLNHKWFKLEKMGDIHSVRLELKTNVNI